MQHREKKGDSNTSSTCKHTGRGSHNRRTKTQNHKKSQHTSQTRTKIEPRQSINTKPSRPDSQPTQPYTYRFKNGQDLTQHTPSITAATHKQHTHAAHKQHTHVAHKHHTHAESTTTDTTHTQRQNQNTRAEGSRR